MTTVIIYALAWWSLFWIIVSLARKQWMEMVLSGIIFGLCFLCEYQRDVLNETVDLNLDMVKFSLKLNKENQKVKDENQRLIDMYNLQNEFLDMQYEYYEGKTRPKQYKTKEEIIEL